VFRNKKYEIRLELPDDVKKNENMITIRSNFPWSNEKHCKQTCTNENAFWSV